MKCEYYKPYFEHDPSNGICCVPLPPWMLSTLAIMSFDRQVNQNDSCCLWNKRASEV